MLGTIKCGFNIKYTKKQFCYENLFYRKHWGAFIDEKHDPLFRKLSGKFPFETVWKNENFCFTSPSNGKSMATMQNRQTSLPRREHRI